MRKARHLTRQGLVNRLADKHTSLDDAEVRSAVLVMLDSMVAALAEGKRIEVRGFGSFEAKKRAASSRRNPRTGAKVQVQAKRVPRFRAGRLLRQVVNKNN